MRYPMGLHRLLHFEKLVAQPEHFLFVITIPVYEILKCCPFYPIHF